MMAGVQDQAAIDLAAERPSSYRPWRGPIRHALGTWLARDRNVFGLAALFVVGAVALAAWIVVSDYVETRSRAEAALGNLVTALEKDIARNIELYDLAIQETEDALRLPGLAAANPELRQAAMFSRIAVAEYMSSILVLDTAGNVVADSDTIVPRGGNFADREYFRYLRANPDTGLYVSAPLPDPYSGSPVIVFARRMDQPTGGFRGVVSGSVRIDYFRHLFSTLELGEGGAITLFRTDGTLIARYPFVPHQTGRNIAGTEPFTSMLSLGDGVAEGVSAVDGVARLYAFRHVGALPLLLTASYGRDVVFAAWRQKAVLVISAIVLLLLMAGTLLVALRRQLARRAEAEARALASAALARRSERTLALSLSRLDTVFQHSADIHFGASRRADGQFAFDLLNRRGEELTGLRAGAVVGKTPDECLSRTAVAVVFSHWENCLSLGEPTAHDYSLQRHGGRAHWETRLVPIHDAEGQVCRLIGTIRDVTGRKETEATLLHLNTALERRAAAAAAAHDDALVRASAAQRLRVLGQLASGIAHDVNNVLQTVAGCASLIERRAGEPQAMQRAARLIADAADRGASITSRLLTFSREEAATAERTRVAPLLANLADILRHTLRGGGSIDIQVQVETETLTVVVDTKQLETVLLNLATNARDAMPAGGTIVLGASSPAERPSELSSQADTGYVHLWVQDDGVGMDADTLARVTEPFFTTKPVGEGTGLGLSMADAYAREAGGLLAIRSAPGRGTTVDLWLPS